MGMLDQYDGKLVRLTDIQGNTQTGIASVMISGKDSFIEAIQIKEHIFFQDNIRHVSILPTYEEAVLAIPLGHYRHFKGGEYTVLAIARDSETTEAVVVYQSLKDDQKVWCRPAVMWNEKVTVNGEQVLRFQKMTE